MTPLAAEFTKFSTSHWMALIVFLVCIPFVVMLGRRVRDTPREPLARRYFALAIVAFEVPMQLVDLRPGAYDFDTSLPLQLCDFAWIAAVCALWTRHWFPCALTYFWGLALTTQALITPDLVTGFPDPKFLGFWGMHYLIVWAAIFLTWGLGVVPTWRSWATTVATTLVWLVGVYLFNASTGTNYGFVNRKPHKGSVLDYLADWPVYVFQEIAIVAAVWVLMTLPWVLVARRKEMAR